MTLANLNVKIAQKEAKLTVIGLGYVGLPLASEFTRVGFDVLGIDLIPERVESINAGISPIKGYEPGLDELLTQVIAEKKLRATTNYAEVKDQDVILIAVETPIDENHAPDYKALRSALQSLGPVLKKGALVIIESTIVPGTMSNVCLPLLEETSGFKLNQRFYLGNCPERVMPGRLLANLRTVSRVVGGMDQETAETMVTLYRHIVQADLDATDCVTAELVKTVENAYRDVQIAFANEVAMICEAIGGDVWKVRELVNKSPYRDMHLPGAGVGGHCIPKDPWLLAYSVKDKAAPLQLITAARNINDSMPYHMQELLKGELRAFGKDLHNSRIFIMGYTYLEDSDDTRNSPSEKLVHLLEESGADVVIHDPFLPDFRGNVYQMAGGCDAAVLMVRHSDYRSVDLARLKNALRTPILLDGRHAFDGDLARNAGLTYRALGQALSH